MAEPQNSPTTAKLVCPACHRTLEGGASVCPSCGGDLRGLGDANETLSGARTEPGGAGTWRPEIGEIIDRRYRIVEKIGEGGMGAVYKVEHVRMGKLMALKLMRPESALSRDAVKRFQQEARIVSRLSHANTVSVFDFGELPEGGLYMAMEFVPGRDLARLLEAESSFSEKRAVSVAIQVLRSLAEAHDAGIVHRDIKPANVMLLRTREGDDFVKLLDFGIAKLAAEARVSERHAATGGDFIGTPLYMSPEAVAGENLDARSDLYSVGVMLFELVTGKPLYDGPSAMAVAAKHLKETPRKVREVAPHLGLSEQVEAVIARALQRDPKDRFQTADEMRAALMGSRESLALPKLTTGDLAPLHAGLAIARRDDWDSFEDSLRWRRRLAPLATLCALAAAGVGAALFLRSPEAAPVRAPVTVEVEPNDGPRTANLIAPGTDVQGFIKRAARDRPDVDLFEFAVPPGEPMGAEISVTGVSNVNLALDLFELPAGEADEARLKNLAHVDDRFLGGGERLTDLKLAPGRYLVRVADKRRADEGPGAPRENTLDPYSLRVDLVPLPRFFEEEPDNILAQAQRVSVARPVFGHAGARGEPTPGASGEAGVQAGLFSDDFYTLVLGKGAANACALLTGVHGAVLSLSVAGIDRARIDAIADSAERAKASSEQLARLGRDKPARVAAGDVEKKCARATETLDVKIAVAEGDSAERYVLAFVDDSDDGFAGVLAACEELNAHGEAATCKALLAKAVAALPVSKSVDAAKKMLADLP